MICKNCGAEIRDGALFCRHCGTKVNAGQEGRSGKKRNAGTTGNVGQGAGLGQGSLGKGNLTVVLMTLAVVLAVATVVLFLFPGVLRQDRSGEDSGALEASGAVRPSEEGGAAESAEPLYRIDDVGVIDLDVRNHTPGTKSAGMKWDNTLFYWLEDADTLSPDDGNIDRCRMERTWLRDSGSGGLIQYEVYRDPDSGEIYKIVSIQEKDGELELTDYYYVDGKPNFIFLRYDSVYTPTYATISKTGERFYFDSDVLVRWRTIRVPQEIEEYTLTPGDAWYPQADYFTESTEVQTAYNEAEIRMLNRAYNTYETLAGGEKIGMVEGCLLDTVGNPVAGAEISIYRDSDDALLYRGVTGEDGSFRIFVYMDDTACHLYVAETAEYRESMVYGLVLTSSASSYSYSLTMHKQGGDEYPVTLCAYPAMEVRTGEEGHGVPVTGVTAFIREGSGACQGEITATVTAEADGTLHTNLLSGTYTAQLTADGYMDTYLEFSVDEGAVSRRAYMVSGPGEGQTIVVMTWDGEGVDLDLTLFTPYQSTDGDMAHIGGNIMEDDHGNSLVADNDRECEVMLVNSGVRGTYKLYVNDYTDSQAGNYESDTLLTVNVHIYIYDDNGFVADYTVPVGQSGVVWEAAEINGSRLSASQRIYSWIEGKSWWIDSKDKGPVVRMKEEEIEYSEHAEIIYTEYDEHGNMTSETRMRSPIVARNEDGTAIFAESEQERVTTYENTYDEYGNLVEQISYDGDIPYEKQEYSYTYVNGQVSEEEEYWYSWDSEYGWGIGGMGTYRTYDEQGRIISEHHDMMTDYWLYGETEEQVTQFVDSLFDETYYDSEYGTLSICDENGTVLRTEYYDCGEERRTDGGRYTYDERGNCVSYRVTDDSGELREDWTYDEYGRLIRHEARSDVGWGDYEETYFYNSQGQVESVHLNVFNDAVYSDSDTNYYYDERGNLIREEEVSYYEDIDAVRAMGHYVEVWYNGSRWIKSTRRTEYYY